MTTKKVEILKVLGFVGLITVLLAVPSTDATQDRVPMVNCTEPTSGCCMACGVGELRSSGCNSTVGCVPRCDAVTHFWDETTGQCKGCNSCTNLHERVLHNCTTETDALCTCEVGYYRREAECRKCQMCVFGVLKPCTAVTDSHCKRAPPFKAFGRTKPNPHSSDEEVSFFENGTNLVPFYCAFLGLVLVGLTVHVLFRHWKLRKAPTKAAVSLPLLVQTQPPAPPPPVAVPLLLRPPATDDVEPYGGFFPSPTATAPKLSERTLRRLESQMDGAKTADSLDDLWAALARRLGYDVSRVRAECLSSAPTARGRVSPSRVLLDLWNCDPRQPDVVGLLQALRAVGWADLGDVVCDEVETV